MNLILFEAKSSLKSSVFWVVSLVGLFALLMLGAYPTYINAKDEVISLLSNYPPEFISAFGMNLEGLFSYGGFYNFSFGYISLASAIMASSLGIAVFAREKRAKCSDFLLTKPISRENIFTQKLFSCLVVIIVTNIIYILSAILMYKASGDNTIITTTFVTAILGILFTQIVFLTFGITFAIVSKKVRSVAGIATAFGFGAFILSAITNVLDNKNIDFIAPLKYFEPNSVFKTGSYDIKLVVVATTIIIICIGISFVKFCKSDTHSV